MRVDPVTLELHKLYNKCEMRIVWPAVDGIKFAKCPGCGRAYLSRVSFLGVCRALA